MSLSKGPLLIPIPGPRGKEKSGIKPTPTPHSHRPRESSARVLGDTGSDMYLFGLEEVDTVSCKCITVEVKEIVTASTGI